MGGWAGAWLAEEGGGVVEQILPLLLFNTCSGKQDSTSVRASNAHVNKHQKKRWISDSIRKLFLVKLMAHQEKTYSVQ